MIKYWSKIMTSLEAEQQLSVTKISEEYVAPHNNSSAYMNSGCKKHINT